MADNIEGLKLIQTRTFFDHRGYFRETYRSNGFLDITGLDMEFVQDNESLSKSVGVLRGLHFQRPPHTQAKLIRVVSGSIFDVAVDLRPSSPTFKEWRSFELSSENGLQLFVPGGFAHGFCTLSENTVVTYKVSDYYSPECDGGVRWNDPELAVAWPLADKDIIVSEKDAALPLLAQLDPMEW